MRDAWAALAEFGRRTYWLFRHGPVLAYRWVRENEARLMAILWIGGMATFTVLMSFRQKRWQLVLKLSII